MSPDGEHVVVTKREANVDVFLYQLAQGALTRLTSEITEDETPIWMGDGRRITFAAARRAQYRLLLSKPMDAGDEVLLLRSERADDHPHPDSWSPDGQTLALTNIRAPFEDADIWLFRPAETPQIRPFLQTKFNEGAARFSPDGRWLAYVSNESGRYEVYVRPFDGSSEKHTISLEGRDRGGLGSQRRRALLSERRSDDGGNGYPQSVLQRSAAPRALRRTLRSRAAAPRKLRRLS